MEFFSRTNIFFPYSIFALCLYFLYFDHLDSLNLMPGNVGDARLNNYFLENTYQFLFGNVNSLWNLNFYSPFPYVLGFSDNLFGSSPVYIAARLLGLNSYTAFQIWFVFGYFLNFIFVYYVLRKLNISLLAATVGAIIFTFSLPTTAHAAHAQLHYRFALPVAVYFFICFFETKSWRYLVVALSWLLWQFYCGIYMGFFTSLLMITILVTFLFLKILKEKISIKDVFNIYKSTWILQTKKMKYSLVFSILVILSLFLLLFFPYFMVSHLY